MSAAVAAMEQPLKMDSNTVELETESPSERQSPQSEILSKAAPPLAESQLNEQVHANGNAVHGSAAEDGVVESASGERTAASTLEESASSTQPDAQETAAIEQSVDADGGALPEDKGKGRADDETEAAAADSVRPPPDKDEATLPGAVDAHSIPPSPVPSSKTPSPPPEIRYALPIGGGRRPSRRRTLTNGSTRRNQAGPSYTSANNGSATTRNRTLSEASSAATIKDAKTETTQSKPLDTVVDDERTSSRLSRRLSGSDIPTRNGNGDYVSDDFIVDAEARKRSNTIAHRSRKLSAGAKRPTTAPATQATFAQQEERPAELHKHATSSSLSSFMIDGQMFTLDDEKRKSVGTGARSLHARSETNGTSLHDGGRLSSSHDHGVDSMMFVDGSLMRNPTAAQDEPMIYDEEELDDVPPQGSYAIHPPSRRRLAEASELSLYDEDGALVRFGTLFETQRTLIIFLRHWFCPFCQMFAQSIQKVDPLPLQRADLGMVVIGQGHWHVTKSYKEVMKIPSFVRMFADPTRKIYTALGMTMRTNDAGPACTRPEYQTMGVLKASLVAIKKGVVDMPIRMPGDVKLLGGEFILGPGLQCSFTHRMVTTRGHLDLPRVLSQAGCDLTLKTPKDVLAERDSVARRRPQSTRSVDRNTARRLAKRIARKTRPATPKDALLIKTQRAAAEAAGPEGESKSVFNSVRGAPPPLPKAVARSISKRFGGSIAADAHAGDGNLAGVDGTVTKVVQREAVDEYDDEDDEEGHERNTATRARKALTKGMQTGFSRTVSMSNAAASKARRVLQQPDRQPSLGNGVAEQDTEWADEAAYVAPAAPPLPRTSSVDAYDAATARQRIYNEEIESLRSDAVVGERADAHRSTASLGRRSTSSRARNERQVWRRRYGQGRPLTSQPPSLSSPDLHGDAALTPHSGARLHRSNSGASQSSASSRRDVPITLPMASSSTTSSASSHTMTNPATDYAAKRNNAQGVPLSVFEQRIKNKPRLNLSGHGYSYSTDDAASLGIAISPRKSSMRYLDASRPSPASPVTAASFGEDTDYKRLSRAKLEEPVRDPLPSPDEENGKGTADSTPKTRVISLHADELSLPSSARTSRDNRLSAQSRQNRVSIMALLPNEDASPTDEEPPPVPPKSPTRFLKLASSPRPSQPPPLPLPPTSPTTPSAVAASQQQNQIPARVPMPAPTPAFASVFANEAAIRNKSQASLASTAAPSVAASIASPTASSFSGPALFAGVPSLRAASSVPNVAQLQSKPAAAAAVATDSQLPSEPPTPTQARPQAPAAPAAFSGNPLQAFAMESVRNGSALKSPPSTSNGTKAKPAQAPKVGNEASFLDDLETVDGFQRTKRMSESADSALVKSPNMTSSSSNADYDDEDDEEDDDGAMYSDDWAPLQARQNAVPAQPKSSNGHHSNEHTSSRGHDDDDEDWSENDTQEEDGNDEFEDVSEGGSHSSHHHQLALLGVLSDGRRGSAGSAKGISGSANNGYVVKRVISRPYTAPSSLNEQDSRGNAISASARKVQLGAGRLPRKPQSADGAPVLSNAGRLLTSFREEEEEEQS